MTQLRLAVSGHGESGKDYVCQRLSELTGLRYAGSTSQAAKHIVYEHYKHMSESDVLSDPRWTADDMWNNRREYRQTWSKAMREYNTPNRTRLYEEMFATNDFLNGIRHGDELTLCLERGLVDLAIWVAREVPPDPTMDYGPELCDFAIDNNGDLNALDKKLNRIADLLL